MSNYPSFLGATASPLSTSGGPNILGGGLYTPQQINVNQGAFNNPLAGTAVPAGNAEIQNYLGATTAPVSAASSAAYGSGLAGEQALAGQYQQLAAGQGPSLATVSAQQQGAANLASAESLLGSARGAGNPAAAQLAARNAQAQGSQQVAQNVVAGRTQEELGALGAMGGLYGNIAGQGLQEQSQLNQIAQGNQANALAAHSNYLGALAGIAGQQQQGQIGGQQLSANTALQQQQLAQQAYENSAANNNKIFGQVLGAATNAAGSLFGI
jgi:hypothetical protein